MAGSCPSCSATVREGDPWCTLCWTDLRPAPPPPVPAAAPVGLPGAAPGSAYDPLTAPIESLPPLPPPPPAPVDPLTAPLAAVLAQPVAADPGAPSTPTWPCVECKARSPIDSPACTTCGTPFGGRISRLDDAKAVRRRYMLLVVGAVVMFLVLLSALTLAGTEAPPKQPAPSAPIVTVP